MRFSTQMKKRRNHFLNQLMRKRKKNHFLKQIEFLVKMRGSLKSSNLILKMLFFKKTLSKMWKKMCPFQIQHLIKITHFIFQNKQHGLLSVSR